jgi:branched-chain amino acid transport system substrate-binding protein
MFQGRLPQLVVTAVLALALGHSDVRAAGEPLNIDVVLPLTGAGAFLGKQEQVAMQLAEKLVNAKGGIHGRPLHFVFSDDETNPQNGVQLVRNLQETKRSLIMGSSIVAVCNAFAPLLRSGPVDYCLSPAIHPEAGSYVFSSGVSSENTISVIVRYARLRGWTRIAMIATTDATGQDGERGLLDVLKLDENKDVQLVELGHFNPSDVTVAAQIARIGGAKPQAVIAWGTGTMVATVFKGLIQAGLEVPVFTTYGNMTYAQMDAYADFLPRQLYFGSGQWPRHGDFMTLDPGVDAAQKDFYAAFAAAGLKPDVAATLAWDPTMIVIGALEKLGPDVEPARLREYLQHLKGFAGLNGIYDFEQIPQRGVGEKDVVVSQWKPEIKTWEIVSKPTGIPVQP